MVEAAQISSGGGCRPVANIQSPSSISASVSSSSSSSWSRSGIFPSEQSAIRRAWIFRSLLSSRISSLQPEQHLLEQQDILTSPVTQLMSGLCFRNRVWPIITFCLPKLVTAKNTCSAWFRYRRFSSTTSVIDHASLGVPSTLRTGIGLESALVVKPFFFTYSRSMNIPVAPESNRAVTDLVSAVSVVWSSILRVRE